MSARRGTKNSARAGLTRALRRIAGAEHVLVLPEQLAPFAHDAAAGIAGHAPVAVVFPADAAQVAAIVRACRARRAPVVPRGAGTGLSGGAVPGAPGAVVLLLERMNRIISIDAKNHTILVEPGVRTAEVDAAAAPQGLFYPPDPGSRATATVGGNIAHNAGGLRGLKYGVTRDYVLALDVVLPDGSRASLGSACVKDVAGYALKELFVGSEGTLGVVTRALLKLAPTPAAIATVLAVFAKLEHAAAAASAVVAARLVPCTLEFLDHATLRAVEEDLHLGLPARAGALLLMETDGHPAAVADEAAQLARIARAHGALETRCADGFAAAERLCAARREAYPALCRRARAAILQDVTVPRSELAPMVRFVEKTARKHQLTVATFGHAGDGNLHPTFLADDRDSAQMARVARALDEIMAETLRCGGTITGEHGVGLAKKKYLPLQRDPASYLLLKTIKRALDPENLFNPGKIF